MMMVPASPKSFFVGIPIGGEGGGEGGRSVDGGGARGGDRQQVYVTPPNRVSVYFSSSSYYSIFLVYFLKILFSFFVYLIRMCS